VRVNRPLLVASLPPVATGDGNKSFLNCNGLRGDCHCCHPFSKSKEETEKEKLMKTGGNGGNRPHPLTHPLHEVSEQYRQPLSGFRLG
jgi:hypothetical protein